jgi:hypothetical protein
MFNIEAMFEEVATQAEAATQDEALILGMNRVIEGFAHSIPLARIDAIDCAAGMDVNTGFLAILGDGDRTYDAYKRILTAVWNFCEKVNHCDPIPNGTYILFKAKVQQMTFNVDV